MIFDTTRGKREYWKLFLSFQRNKKKWNKIFQFRLHSISPPYMTVPLAWIVAEGRKKQLSWSERWERCDSDKLNLWLLMWFRHSCFRRRYATLCGKILSLKIRSGRGMCGRKLVRFIFEGNIITFNWFNFF